MLCSLADERFASIALEQAEKSTMNVKHGCVAVCNGKIMAKGYNTDRTYSKDRLIHGYCSCHAEIDVLRKCKKFNLNLHKTVIYVVRKGANGTFSMSAPCIDCSNMLKKNNIKYLVFSDEKGELSKCKMRNYDICHMTGGRRAIDSKRIIIY